MSEHHLLIFLLQVLVLLTLARSVGELLRRWGHAPIVGEILVGVLLGPTLLGRAAPELQQLLFPEDPVQQGMLAVVSWFGMLFLLLETGLEVDVTAAWRQRGPALRIGVIGVLVPLIVGRLSPWRCRIAIWSIRMSASSLRFFWAPLWPSAQWSLSRACCTI